MSGTNKEVQCMVRLWVVLDVHGVCSVGVDEPKQRELGTENW